MYKFLLIDMRKLRMYEVIHMRLESCESIGILNVALLGILWLLLLVGDPRSSYYTLLYL